ncbi:tripartite tricarboxylate transporter TctB family protein [Paenibacillus doosanensis]|uniref:Tripartite tricarboxylate transporter TctB family protein n=1 Tax=Paenibacillus konkukensis TaxID=2020716 RepID=A0ABY4RIL6_9BACL|nr:MULTISPECIES: tripartite tricarboxylate transporter TctB family protein [Paenibacillus]MCS7462671.1 tripartite tricarboxylate transporter TctB family protein [Paenibacillus doosanensis]UQZ82284.1 Tripartite tricarboxylate transporter TctB family protein [Paenibacillus konkukensis]
MNHTFDRYAGIVFLAVGAVFAIGSRSISTSAYGSNVGANIFPMVLGIALSLLSLRLIYESFRKQRAQKKRDNLDYKRFAVIFAAAVLYACFLEDIGFVISTFLFLLIGFQTMQRGRIWVSLLIAAAFSYGVYFLYVNVLDGSLPGFPAWLGLS